MIEQDLTAFAPQVLSLPHAEATVRLEQLIRSYDPCISCATHFLTLEIEPTTDPPSPGTGGGSRPAGSSFLP